MLLSILAPTIRCVWHLPSWKEALVTTVSYGWSSLTISHITSSHENVLWRSGRLAEIGTRSRGGRGGWGPELRGPEGQEMGEMKCWWIQSKAPELCDTSFSSLTRVKRVLWLRPFCDAIKLTWTLTALQVVFVGMMIGSSFWGWLADNYGRKTVSTLYGVHCAC